MRYLKFIFLLLLCISILSCEKETDKKSDWELRIDFVLYSVNGYIDYRYPYTLPPTIVTIYYKTEEEIDEYIKNEYDESTDCNFYYCKKGIILNGHDSPLYEIRGTKRRLN